MKKGHYVFLIALLIIAFGVYIYFFPPVRSTNATPNASGDNQPVCVECATETVGEPINHFKKVVENYRDNIWNLINDNRRDNTSNNLLFTQTGSMPKASLSTAYPTTDSRSIWFPLESIKQFICTIENNNAKLKNPASDLGIRFYYAVYESDFANVNKRNRHTLFMVPTCSNGSGTEVDYDPRETHNRQSDPKYQGSYDDRRITFSDLLNENSGVNALILTDNQPVPAMRSTNLVQQTATTGTNMVKNNGELCPTNCPTPNTLTAIDH